MGFEDKPYKPSENVDAIADKIWQLFIHRADSYYRQRDDGTWIHVKEPLTKNLIRSHLEGKITVGPCLISLEDNTVRFIGWDIDPEHVNDPQVAAKQLYQWCAASWSQSHVLLTATRYPDASYHVFVCFLEPIPADVAKWLGERAVEKAGLSGVEVFPKQPRLTGEFGNTIRLPLGFHREAKKWSRIIHPETFQPLPNEAILDFYPATLTQQQIAQVQAWIKEAKQKRLNQYARAVQPLPKGINVYEVPCIKAFHATPIPPSYRHMAPAKNFAILYWQAYGGWEGFNEWAEWLVEGQPDFKASDVIGWRKWVEEAPRERNCAEVSGFLKQYIEGFNCKGCPIERGLGGLGGPTEGIALDWCGGVVRELDLVYEPLGQGEYVWRLGNERGISRVQAERGEGIEDVRSFSLRIGSVGARLKPISKGAAKAFFGALPFRVPTRATLESWVKGERKSQRAAQLFPKVEQYLTLVLDLEERFESKIMAIWVFHTWLRQISEWAGNIDVGGPFGSGKTTAIEAVAEISYHAVTGTSSPSNLARMAEKYRCTWVIDEYDKARKLEENLLDMLIRQGDRKGFPVYRWNYKLNREESFDPFGPKLISYHTWLETALKQRSIYHLKMTKSPDHRLPIINMARSQLSQFLLDELFLWYMDNITKALPVLPELPDFPEVYSAKVHDGEQWSHNAYTLQKSGNTGNSGNALRQAIYNAITSDLAEGEKELLKKLSARGAELGFIMIRVARAIGLEGYINDLSEALEIKALEEEEVEQYEPVEIVKKVLASHLEDGKTVEILQSDVYKEAYKIAKEEWGQELTPQKFGRILREIGFREKKNIRRKHGGARLLVLDRTIQKQLPPPEKPGADASPQEQSKVGGGEGGSLDYGFCKVCGKPGAKPRVRSGGVFYLHPQCEGRYEGEL